MAVWAKSLADQTFHPPMQNTTSANKEVKIKALFRNEKTVMGPPVF
jgi:hypothetical protein